jgi:hypothetical protein
MKGMRGAVPSSVSTSIEKSICMRPRPQPPAPSSAPMMVSESGDAGVS